MQSLETYRRAVIEYSRLRPHLVYEEWTPPAPGQKLQQLPEGAIGVQSINYGDWAPLNEVMLAGAGVTVWDDTSGQLALSPAPTADTRIAVVWKKVHPVGDDGATPTIPLDHIPYVEDLEQALVLEREADDIEQGPVTYAIGQTQISRDGAAAGLRTRAAQLRQKVEQALEDPLAVWG